MTSPSRRRGEGRSDSEMSHLLSHLPAGDGDIITLAGDGYHNMITLATTMRDAVILPNASISHQCLLLSLFRDLSCYLDV